MQESQNKIHYTFSTHIALVFDHIETPTVWQMLTAWTDCVAVFGQNCLKFLSGMTNGPTYTEIYNTNAKQKNKNIIRPHRYTKHEMRATASDIVWSVCVCLSVRHNREPYKNSWTDWDAVVDSGGPKKPCTRLGHNPPGKGPFWGDMSHPIVKYRQTLQ